MHHITAMVTILILITSTAAAEIYKWRDENGKLQFSDKPPTYQTAKEVKLFDNGATVGTPDVPPPVPEAPTLRRKKQITIPVSATIKNECNKKWGTDYRMVKYCIEKQTDAKSAINSLPGLPSTKNVCREKWGTDYRMVKYCIEKQTAAKSVINSLHGLPSTKNACREKWGADYRMVKYCIETQTKAKSDLRSMSFSRALEQSCEKKWGNDYRMVKYCIERGG
jgi:hypothetical protein